MDYYREHEPASVRNRYTDDVDSEGKKIKEQTFDWQGQARYVL